MDDIQCIQLDCGAVLVAEPIPNVASAAVNWLLPVGSAGDPEDGDGLSVLLSELIFRGAGGLSSRELSDAFDRLGASRSASANIHHLRISAVALGDRIGPTMELIKMMVLEPALPETALDAVRSLCIQSLDALEDDPQRQVMLLVRQHHLPPPFNRHGYGQRSVLESTGIEEIRASWHTRCRPRPTIISAAGAINPLALADQLNRLLEGWSGEHPDPTELAPPARGQVHLEQETAQVHVGVAYDAPSEPDERSMLERLATAVLSGGTSARLFTEVRQRRSLCYSVNASYRPDRDRGMIMLYAGTTPERAQQTLDVCLEEINRLRQGVTEEELSRAVTGLKSHLVMQGESTSARAAAIAADCFRLGRPRSLRQLIDAVDAISFDALDAYVRDREMGQVTIASIGSVPLHTALPTGG